MFPPYCYVPGGPWPHPVTDPAGYAYGQHELPTPIVAESWQDSVDYRQGVALFNAGYYWEAHEVWEGLWHVHGRTGPIADLLEGLIKVAAAGVKVRQAQWYGVLMHLHRAIETIAAVRASVGPTFLGLDLDRLLTDLRQLADDPPATTLPLEAPAEPVLGLVLVFGKDGPGSRD